MRIDCCKSYIGKQIIGLLPNQSECLFYYAPDINVDGYRIDGIIYDDYSVIDADLNPYDIYYFITFLPDSGEPRFILTYVGTEPPTYLPSITDNNGDPVTWVWTTCCTKVCLEMTINENDFSYFQNGYGYICIPPVAGFDDQIPMDTFLKSLYGQQTTYTAVYNPSDATFFVTIDNAYVCNPPLAWSGDNVTYTDMVPCSGNTPVAPKCLYYAQTFNYSSGWSAFGLDIDGTYFPNAGLPQEIGTSIQSAYQLNAGGYSYNTTGQDIWLWSLENDPIDTNWKILNYDDFNWYPVDMSLLTCDLKTGCYYVDIPVGGGIIDNFVLGGIAPFQGQSLTTPFTTNDPAFVIFLQSIFGGQADITLVDNGGSCYIEISKCYVAIAPKSIIVNGVNYGFAPC